MTATNHTDDSGDNNKTPCICGSAANNDITESSAQATPPFSKLFLWDDGDDASSIHRLKSLRSTSLSSLTWSSVLTFGGSISRGTASCSIVHHVAKRKVASRSMSTSTSMMEFTNKINNEPGAQTAATTTMIEREPIAMSLLRRCDECYHHNSHNKHNHDHHHHHHHHHHYLIVVVVVIIIIIIIIIIIFINIIQPLRLQPPPSP